VSEIEIFRKVMPELYWCPRCNVPVFDENCGKCNGFTIKVRVTPPGDVRPAFKKDIEDLRKTLYDYFTDWNIVDFMLPRNKFVLLNKIEYPDAADEIIVDGQILGHRFYDVEKRLWRFKPLYNGVAGILKLKTNYYAIVALPRIRRRFVVHKKHIVEAKLPSRKGEYVAISTEKGNLHGIAEYVGASRLRVLKAWRGRKFLKIDAEGDFKVAIEANKHRLENLENEAIDFIKKVVDRYNLPVIVSFSGGKDSLATFLLVEKALGKVPILFNDTGLELPETVEFVKEFAEKNGVELLVADAGKKFYEALEIMGPPARDYRWCCKVAKLSPIANLVNTKFPEGVLSFVGQRALESTRRALSPRVWRNRWLIKIVAASPIQYWTALDIWLYLFKEKIEANPLYFEGFDRLGCWLCPAVELGELEAVAEKHPELVKWWTDHLKKYAEEHGLGEAWVRFGFWRWRKLPGDQKRIAEKYGLKIEKDPRGAPIEVTSFKVEEGVPVRVYGKIEGLRRLEYFQNLLHTLGQVDASTSLDEIMVKTSDSIFRIKPSGEFILSSKPRTWKKILLNILSIAFRASYCVKCGSCVSNCPKNAITYGGEGVLIDLDKCTKCGLCNFACPIAVYSLPKLNIFKLLQV